MPFAFTDTVVLQTGIGVKLVDAATATGVARSQQFGVCSVAGGVDRVVEWEVEGTFTVCTADLEERQGGNTTWKVRDAALDFNAKKAGYFNAQPGVEYRLNIKTFTGTSVTVTTATG